MRELQLEFLDVSTLTVERIDNKSEPECEKKHRIIIRFVDAPKAQEIFKAFGRQGVAL
ncbi:hypothetical protein O9K51_00175 [Purpureocillium lavendulum]|uniref:RRM domain-containing protein n=1 Tax=Purpureocillium lavendulum TaxID=1247861 RepID=A0AB34G3K5_9HYPO|nr:hypothetical protein O9K51_00175 [Purpureocillium lavendulum]